jgi:hypothetical protein
MFLEQLPLELAEMVFDRLDAKSSLRMLRVCRMTANVAKSYMDRFTCILRVLSGGIDLATEFSRADTGREQDYTVFRQQAISDTDLVHASDNGLSFWLQRLRMLTVFRMDSNYSVDRFIGVITALEAIDIQKQVDVDIVRKMWLGSPEFASAMSELQATRLDLSVAGRIVAKHSFTTQRSKNSNLMSLGKMTSIHMQIPGNRMVSDRLVFEDDSVLRQFKVTSCGNERPSLWNVGAMVDLFANCNNVRLVDLRRLNISVDIPLLSADWRLSSVEKLTLTDCNFRMSNRARRRGNKGKKGSLQQAGCFVAVLEAPGIKGFPIKSATFVRDNDKQQLVLDKLNLNLVANLTASIVTREVFRTSPVRHLTLRQGLDMDVLHTLIDLKKLEYLYIHPPVQPMTMISQQQRQNLEARVNQFFSELDQNCPNLVQVSVAQLNMSLNKSALVRNPSN